MAPVELAEAEAAAEAVWFWIRRWYEPKDFKKASLRRRSHARFLAWFALVAAHKWRQDHDG